MILSKSNSRNREPSSEPEVAFTPKNLEKHNILAEDVVLRGSIAFEGELQVDGRVEGTIESKSGSVVIGASSTIEGDVASPNITVHGEVHGNLSIDDRCVLAEGCKLIGDLKASSLMLEEGAVFWGKSQVGTSPKSGKAPARK